MLTIRITSDVCNTPLGSDDSRPTTCLNHRYAKSNAASPQLSWVRQQRTYSFDDLINCFTVELICPTNVCSFSDFCSNAQSRVKTRHLKGQGNRTSFNNRVIAFKKGRLRNTAKSSPQLRTQNSKSYEKAAEREALVFQTCFTFNT